MNNLFVSCEPKSLSQGSDRAVQAIQSLGDCIKINNFFWYVRSAKSAADASIVVRAACDPNDVICVVDATNETIALDATTLPETMSAIRQNWNKKLA